MIFLQGKQQWSLSENRVACQQFQARIHLKQFFEMLPQATRLVRLIALDIPTGKMQFEFLGENIELENRIAVSVFRLFRRFSINGGDDESVGKNGVHKHSEGIL